MQTLCPESGLRTAPNWPKIRKMTMTSQFSDMTSTSNFFDVVLFLLSSLVTGPSFMSISSLALELWQFSFIRDWPEIRKLEITTSEFLPISWHWGELWIPNLARMYRILLNAAKFQGYRFYRFWVIKGKPTGGRVKLPPPTQIRVKRSTITKKYINSANSFLMFLNNYHFILLSYTLALLHRCL